MKCSTLVLSFAIIVSLLTFIFTGCGSAPGSDGSGPYSVAAKSSSASGQASSKVRVVMASGILQKCLGITPGADKMMRGPATKQYCQQLPGADIYDQAGQRFQAGDHAGAAKIVTKAAEAGNAVAQLRLALMYDQGDGVERSSKMAFGWYARAASKGEPESQNQMAMYYELAEGVPENWDLSARLLQASATQGWKKGQFSFGRAYQFGIGVAQDRQKAIEWFRKSGAQGNPNGNYWAKWLSDRTNNIGFRDDIERSIVMDKVGGMRFAGNLAGGDPFRRYLSQFRAAGDVALWPEEGIGQRGGRCVSGNSPARARGLRRGA
jgi:TPR repeat protein